MATDRTVLARALHVNQPTEQPFMNNRCGNEERDISKLMTKSVSETQICTTGSILTHDQSGYIGTECLTNGFEQDVIDLLRIYHPLYCKSQRIRVE